MNNGESLLTAMGRHGIRLALFAALTTAPVAVIHLFTEPFIARQAALRQQGLLDEVIPADLYNNDLKAECYVVTGRIPGKPDTHRLWLARMNGQPVAVAIETTAPDGWSGAIQLLVGADFHGHVLGTRVTEHHETPGLGDKIDTRISDWITRFTGKQLTADTVSQWAVKKDGGIFDQFTSATITPRAVVNAVKNTLIWLENLPDRLPHLQNCRDQLDESHSKYYPSGIMEK